MTSVKEVFIVHPSPLHGSGEYAELNDIPEGFRALATLLLTT